MPQVDRHGIEALLATADGITHSWPPTLPSTISNLSLLFIGRAALGLVVDSLRAGGLKYALETLGAELGTDLVRLVAAHGHQHCQTHPDLLLPPLQATLPSRQQLQSMLGLTGDSTAPLAVAAVGRLRNPSATAASPTPASRVEVTAALLREARRGFQRFDAVSGLMKRVTRIHHFPQQQKATGVISRLDLRKLLQELFPDLVGCATGSLNLPLLLTNHSSEPSWTAI